MSIGLKSLMSNKPVTSSVLMIRGKEDHADWRQEILWDWTTTRSLDTNHSLQLPLPIALIVA
jgi:hypothetical protein